MTGDSVTQSYTDLWRLIRTARPSALLLAVAGLAALASAGGTLWFPLLTKRFIDHLSPAAISWPAIGLLAGVLVAGSLLGAVSHYVLSRIGYEVIAVLRRNLVERLLALPVPAFDCSDTGERVSRVIHDCESISDLVSTQVINLLSGLLVLFGSVGFMLMLDARLTFTLLACIAGAFVVILPVSALMNGLSQQVQDRTAALGGILTHVFSEIRLVKAFTAENAERARSQAQIDELRRTGLRVARLHVALEPIMSLAISVAMVVILAYGAARVVRGDIGIGTLTAYILYIFNIVGPLLGLTGFMTELQKARGASSRIGAILQEAGETQGDAVKARGAVLEFRNVSFGYETLDTPVLDGIDLVFEPGTTTALVGTSGSGKTTILSLIERFYAPGGGAILYGGRPIADYPLVDWRRSIGYVAQSAPVMPGSVRDNITYGLDAPVSDAAVRDAARQAGALDFIDAMPQGLDTELIEQGNNLSGGQRQRIAIARMFLRDPDILILDEATSNLDSETEHHVKLALEALMKGRTNIVVAHRLFTIMHTDRIYFVENGRISGAGNHLALIDTHPQYARLVERQALQPLRASAGA